MADAGPARPEAAANEAADQPPGGFWTGFGEGRREAAGKTPPHALSRALKNRLVRRLGGTARGRVGAAAAFRALSVLVRKHPDAALDMAGAAVLEAGRAGFSELKRVLAAPKPGARPALKPPGDRAATP